MYLVSYSLDRLTNKSTSASSSLFAVVTSIAILEVGKLSEVGLTRYVPKYQYVMCSTHSVPVKSEMITEHWNELRHSLRNTYILRCKTTDRKLKFIPNSLFFFPHPFPPPSLSLTCIPILPSNADRRSLRTVLVP